MEEKNKKLVLKTLYEMEELHNVLASKYAKIAQLLVDVNPELINFKKEVSKRVLDNFSLNIYLAMKEFSEENSNSDFWRPHYMDLLDKAGSDKSSKKVGYLVRKIFMLDVDRDSIGYMALYNQEDLDRIKEMLVKAGHEVD